MNESLKFSQFGADNGQLVIYFHGSPGAPEECAIFDSCGKEHGLTFISFDRFSIHASLVAVSRAISETFALMCSHGIPRSRKSPPTHIFGMGLRITGRQNLWLNT